MLKIVLEGREYFDETTNEFITVKEQTLTLEHSLVSLSKWESKWHKPFLSKEPRTYEENLDYIKCMTIQKVDPSVYLSLTEKQVNEIKAYIDDPMTATTFRELEGGSRKSRDVITSEIIYYWMVTLNIPFECEKWHLNRLTTLIRVCNEKQQPQKKMSRKQLATNNSALNAARRKALNSNG